MGKSKSIHKFESDLALLPRLSQTVLINTDTKWVPQTHLLVNQALHEINVASSVIVSGVGKKHCSFEHHIIKMWAE